MTTALFRALFFFVVVTTPSFGEEAPRPPRAIYARLADSINPGSAEYFLETLESARKTQADFVVLQLDTPGGLLHSTRLMVQAMLQSPVPVVVFVGPSGAHAGSAGALITFAADIAVMAPGTHIGAAHPVSIGGESPEGSASTTVLEKKITNDTAAFAESLATAKGRNAEWAIRAVRESESIIAETALKMRVIDFIASDENDLLQKLRGYRLLRAKGSVARLPSDAAAVESALPSLKHRVVSFFADPTLAYLILTVGAACLWIELTHPGLIAPGVVGALAIGVSLVSFQLLPIHYGALGLLLLGLALMALEIFVPSFGALGLGGIVAFVLGSVYLIDTPTPQFQIPLALILPTAASLALAAGALAFIVYKSRSQKPLRGTVGSLLGEIAVVQDPVSDTAGTVLCLGELWQARSGPTTMLAAGTQVRVLSAERFILIVEPKDTSV